MVKYILVPANSAHRRLLAKALPGKANIAILAIFMGCLACTESGEMMSNAPSFSTVPVPSFPGAEGYGARSVGGRGGRVIEVTNLKDSGPGSLRNAIEAAGPRIIVFRTGGLIVLRSGLTISQPYITIAGQTAPGGGITLKNHPSNTEAPLYIKTHDVIIRHVRSRPGPSIVKTDQLDALRISGYNVIIDHCSLSWATDEVASTWRNARHITIQWSIIAEGLKHSTHFEESHSKGLLLGSVGSEKISIHHNLFAHNEGRNPRINTSGVVDVVNNVIYNYGWSASVVAGKYARGRVNYVSNYLKSGPNSKSDYLVSTDVEAGDGFELYIEGNRSPLRRTMDLDEALVVKTRSRKWVIAEPHKAPPISTTTTFEAYDQVLAWAGAILPARDVVDERVVNDVRNGTGRIIDDPAQVDGWPSIEIGKPPKDTDHDGMPDEWENRYGFDTQDGSDGRLDADDDGYTNVEEYLNATNPLNAVQKAAARQVENE